MEKLPHGGQPDTIAISNSDPNDNIELAVNPDKQRLQELEELEYMMAARNAKSYFVFASCLALLGLAFSITSMVSCSFGVVNWAVDGDTSAYQADVTHLGLFRWYNHKTSSCWAYNPLDTDFFYVDKAARGLAAAAVVFGGCAAWIVVIIFVANYLACCVKRGCCSRFNLNSTSNSTTFFSLSGLTFLASLLQICTLTYFNQGNVPSYVVTCNANKDSNCTMGVGAHYAIIAFVVYLIACFVYAMAGVGCRVVEGAYKEKSSGKVVVGGGGGGVAAAAAEEEEEEEEDNSLPPPPPPFPPHQMGGQVQEEDLGSLDSSSVPPPAPSAQFVPYTEDASMQSV
jgi:hypothetical protein